MTTHMLTIESNGVTGVTTFTTVEGGMQTTVTIDGVQVVDTLYTLDEARTAWKRAVNNGWVVTTIPTVEVTPAAKADLIPGCYVKGADVYRVKISKTSGKPYANLWEAGTYVYAPGVVKTLSEDMRMTVEQAVEFAGVWDCCAWCGRKLTAATSVARGIGPVCIKRFR